MNSSERIEEIEKALYKAAWAEDVSCEDIRWLLKLARLQSEVIAKQREALKYYGDAKLLLLPKSNDGLDIRSRQLLEENGAIAREALTESEKILEGTLGEPERSKVGE